MSEIRILVTSGKGDGNWEVAKEGFWSGGNDLSPYWLAGFVVCLLYDKYGNSMSTHLRLVCFS